MTEGAYVIAQQTAQVEPLRPTRTAERVEPEEPMVVDTIIVRGERLERSKYETASSVEVFTDEDLRRNPGLRNTNDILAFTPNVTIGAGNEAPAIRGVASNGPLSGTPAITGGARPRATTVLDGRVLTFNEYVFGATSVYDIDQIEVFRGPQTSVQGANNIAGSIFVFTEDPTFDFEAGLLAEVQEFDGTRFAGFVSAPIVEDELAIRLTADYQRRDTFVEYGDPNLTNLAPDDVRNDPRLVESENIRGKLLWTPSDIPDFTAKLTLSYIESTQPSLLQVQAPFEDLAPRAPFGDGRSRVDTESTYGVLDLSYSFGDGFELVNQTTYSDYFVQFINAALPTPLGNANDGTQFSNETILRFEPSDSWLSGLAGVYYFEKNEDNLAPAFGGVGAEDSQTSLGIYAAGVAELTDKLSLTAAIRYQRDTQDRIGSYQIPFPGFPFVEFDFEGTYEVVLPRFELAYDFSDNLRIGALLSRGTNPGGIVPNVLPQSVANPIGGTVTEYDNENVWTYEAFTRAAFLDGRLRFAGNLFYSDYEDFQLFTVVGFTPLPSAVVNIDNIETAFSYGFEAEAEFDVTDQFSVFSSFGVIESRLDEVGFDGEVERREFGNSPPVTAAFGANFKPFDALSLSAQARYSSSYSSTSTDDPDEVVGDFLVANLSASYDFGPAEIYAYANNVFDEFYVTNVSFGGQFAFPGAPRTLGAGIRLEF
ncbi:MAG: TonB-dependent receptor [Pseudomonadota bacterium]